MAKKRANGEGSIRKKPSGRWEGRYTQGIDPVTGKAIQKSVSAKTQSGAKKSWRKRLLLCPKFVSISVALSPPKKGSQDSLANKPADVLLAISPLFSFTLSEV